MQHLETCLPTADPDRVLYRHLVKINSQIIKQAVPEIQEGDKSRFGSFNR